MAYDLAALYILGRRRGSPFLHRVYKRRRHPVIDMRRLRRLGGDRPD